MAKTKKINKVSITEKYTDIREIFETYNHPAYARNNDLNSGDEIYHDSNSEIFYPKDNYGVYDSIINKLATCHGHYKNHDHEKRHSCHLSFCPVCIDFKKIKESAIYYQVLDKMGNNSKFNNFGTKFLTLKIPFHHIRQTPEKIYSINSSFDKFMDYKKQNGSTPSKRYNISLKEMLFGYSKFVHISLNGSSEDAGVHVHVILFINPMYDFDDPLVDEIISERWSKANGYKSCGHHINPIENTPISIINTVKYGITTLKHESIKESPEKLLTLKDILKGIRTASHYKGIRSSRIAVRSDYKKRKDNIF